MPSPARILVRLLARLPRRLFALLLAFSLFVPAASFGKVLYSCAMSGKVSRGPCCCHQAKMRDAARERAHGLSRVAKAERPECCKAEEQRGGTAPSVLDDGGGQVQAAALVGLVPVELEPQLEAESFRLRAAQSRGPPRGEPIFVANCAFLI
jgi:hypothetical protein